LRMDCFIEPKEYIFPIDDDDDDDDDSVRENMTP